MLGKVLVLNGSPHVNGCTATALGEVIKTLNGEGIATELVQVGKEKIRGCIACNYCRDHGKCVFNDKVNEIAQKLESADGLIVGSPVYYAGPNATLLATLDRLFYSTMNMNKTMKVGAAVVNCRRGGNTAAFDRLNKYFAMNSMPLVTSTYWNQTHGFTSADVKKDLEGLQTMRNLGRNMAFLIKAISAEKKKSGLPQNEAKYFTSFPDGKTDVV